MDHPGPAGSSGAAEEVRQAGPPERDLLASVEAAGDYVDMGRFNRDVRPETFTEIGTGVMDIQAIIDTANEYCGSEYIVLEQDYSQHDELESIAISMDSFRKFKGVEW